MKDPVIAGDGITYERKSIEEWISKRDTSPFTGAPLPHKTLISNIALRSAAGTIIEKNKKLDKK